VQQVGGVPLSALAPAVDRLLAILHRLKGRGAVEGSSLHLTITAAGRELLGSVDPAFHTAIESAIGRIDPERLRVAIEVLEEVRAAP
jgi:hypothetical protein